jgi:predicted GNAT family N-acyltransferase
VIKLAIAIKSSVTRERFHESLMGIASRMGSSLSDVCELMEINDGPDSLIACIKDYFSNHPTGMALLISDWLASNDPELDKTALLKRCEAEFGKELLGTIAIMPQPTRKLDIDRTVGSGCTNECLANAVRMVVDRLRYISVPVELSNGPASCITVRSVRIDNLTELREYFSLRHKVYTIMGYLDEETENCRSKLEVNEADLHAIHIGAFCRAGVQEKLVGTARVVTNGAVDEALHENIRELVKNDPIARKNLDTPYALGLPIFQSQPRTNEIMKEVFGNNQSCGELSRVIVAPQYRGRGVSTRLIDAALRKSIAKGTRRLFLECLAVHTSLYQKHGFRCISGVAGQVVDVARTMVAMELAPKAIDNVLDRAG